MVLLYAANKSGAVATLERAVMEALPRHPLMHCRSLQILEQRLRRPCHDIKVIVILVADAIEMRELILMRSLLLDLRLVIVLPSRDPDVIAWAHKLSPRFISYTENGPRQVTAVLDKMLNANKVVPFPALP